MSGYTTQLMFQITTSILSGVLLIFFQEFYNYLKEHFKKMIFFLT